MQINYTDPVNWYKNHEKQWNKDLMSELNSDEFVQFIGTWINAHLTEVIEKRKIINFWLEAIRVPSRDDIALLAKIIIKQEEQADFLEEQLFSLIKESQQVAKVLTNTKNDLRSLKYFLDKEVEQWPSKTKVELLKEELGELIASL